jgi:hypothetical protein
VGHADIRPGQAQGDDLVQKKRKGTSLLVCVLEQTVSQSMDKLELSRFALSRGPYSRSHIEQEWNGGSQGGRVKNQGDFQDTTIPSSKGGSAVAYLVAGLGVGAALSIFLAPRSGAETRQWIANKCLDGLDTANKSVRHTRRQVRDVMDQGQAKISEAVKAGREAIHKS